MPKAKMLASDKDATSWKDAAELMRQAAAGAASQAAAYSKLADFYEKADMSMLGGSGGAAGGKKRKVKRVKEEGQPKRAKSAYIHFVVENMSKIRAALTEAQGTDFKQRDIMTKLGEGWQSMSDDAKAPYAAKAAAAKEHYAVEIEAFNAAKGEASAGGAAVAAAAAVTPSSSQVEAAATESSAGSSDADAHRKKHKKDKKNKDKKKDKKGTVASM